MKLVKQISLVALGSVLVIGCGKSTQDLANLVSERALQKTWSLGCSEGLIKLSGKQFYQYKGKDFAKVNELYSDTKCTTAVALIKGEGGFDLKGDDTRAGGGAKDIDYHFSRYIVKALSADGQKTLETIGFCGAKSFPVNQEVDVTAQVGGVTCPIGSQHEEFGLYHVDGDNLQLDESKFFGRATSADKRTTKLDTKNVYHPENRSFL